MQQKWLLFFALLVVAFQMLISFPLIMWAENQFNFAMGLADAALLTAAGLVLIVSVVFLICMLTPGKVTGYLAPFLALLSVLIYLQQNILIWDYGILDGASIDFANNKNLGYIDLSLWLAGLAAYLLLREFIAKKTALILTFTAGVTLITTAGACLSFDANYTTANASLTEDKKFSFSSQRNILLFVLDGFQSDLFWEIIDKHPELRRQFGGFTFYPNTSAVFAKTYPSIPLLLTGKTYQKKQPIIDFINNAYADSLLVYLLEAGWDVGLYPMVKATVVNSRKYATNVADESAWSEKMSSYLQALDLSLFRMVPHAVKSYIYNDGDFVVQKTLSGYVDYMHKITAAEEAAALPKPYRHDGLNFLSNLQQTISVELTRPAFRFYHLKMPHQPFMLNSELEYGRIGDDFNAYREYAYATIKLTVAYLVELRKHGVYDNSTIIIATDHGGGEHTSKKYIAASGRYAEVDVDGKAKASARALLLVKGAAETGALTLSYKPVSLLDVAPSIAAYAGLESRDFRGSPVAEISEDKNRIREYNYYEFTGWDSKYLDDFDVFNIAGNVYDDEAWSRAGTLTATPDAAAEKPYALADIVRYGSDIKANADHSNAFLDGDDYRYEESALQAEDRSIKLAVDLAQPLARKTLYALQLRLATAAESPRAEVSIGDVLLDSVILPSGSARQHTFFFEPRILDTKDKVPVEIRVADSSAGEGTVSLAAMSLFEARVAALNNTSFVRFADDIDRYYPFGFWPVEPWGRWTARGRSYLYFLAGEDFCNNAYLLLRMKKFYANVKAGDFTIDINGRTLAAPHFSHDGNEILYYFDCSKKDFLRAGVNKLVFKPGERAAQASFVDVEDKKTQGAAFISLQFIEQGAVKKKILPATQH